MNKKKNAKMNTKRTLVSFLLIASVLFLAGMVSATDIAKSVEIKVDGVTVVSDSSTPFVPNGINVSVNAGDTAEVRVEFKVLSGITDGIDNDGDTLFDEADEASYNSLYDASDVKVKVTLEGVISKTGREITLQGYLSSFFSAAKQAGIIQKPEGKNGFIKGPNFNKYKEKIS